MATGKVHERVTKTMMLPAFIIGYLFSDNIYLGLLSLLGSIIGLVVECDLDIPLVTVSESKMKKIPVVGTVWVWIWKPYSNMIPHRSLISHLPILSTFFRYLYLSAFVVPVWLMFAAIFNLDPAMLFEWADTNKVGIAYVLFGNALTDYAHFAMDFKWIVLGSGKIKFL